MKNEKMWAFLIHLGSNMWAKKGTTWGRNILPEDFGYKETMYCDKEVWRKVTDFLPENGFNTIVIDIGEGLILDSHPELAVPGAWTKDELKSELARLRSIGLTPIPTYNFSCRHNAWMGLWAYRVGTPEYYEFCRDVIEETVEIFDNPPLFHLGFEEEEAPAEHEVNICRSPKKKIADLNFMFGILRSKGVRPWIWFDETIFKSWEHFEEVMPKDVLLSPWFYGSIADRGSATDIPKGAMPMRELDLRGYEQIPTCSTWSWHCNTKETMIYCRKYLDNGTVSGYMTAPWILTTPSRLYALYNDAYTFGWAKKEIYSDEYDKYLEEFKANKS